MQLIRGAANVSNFYRLCGGLVFAASSEQMPCWQVAGSH